MPWIYERPNEYFVFCFVFYVWVINDIYSGLVRVSQTFWVTDLYLQIFFIMDPNLMSHQFFAKQER